MARKAQTKVTDSEYAALERLAAAKGQTVSMWVYSAIQEKAAQCGVELPNKRRWVKKDK